MGNDLIFKYGNSSSLPAKKAGQLLFAIDGSSGSIYLDKDGSNRIKLNADALKLQNAVSINDTNFDGSSGIITNKWGFARELSLGQDSSGSVSLDGSTNVILNVTNNKMKGYEFISGIAPQVWYKSVATYTNSAVPTEDWYIKITLTATWISDLTPLYISADYSNKAGKLIYNLDAQSTLWVAYRTDYAGSNILAIRRAQNSSNKTEIFIKLAKPTVYNNTTYPGNITVYSPYTIESLTTCTAAEAGDLITLKNGYNSNTPITTTAQIYGNASSADKWKTGKTITIGNTGKSVDGSGPVTWSLAEIAGNNYFVFAKSNVTATMNEAAKYYNAMGMIHLNAPASGTASNVNPGGAEGWHHFINMSYQDGGAGDNSWITQIANKAGTTDLWIRSRAGGTISDSTAWAAPWTRIVTGSNFTSVLDGTYVNVSGDTMTDSLHFSNTGATSGVFKGVRGMMADNDYWRVGGSQTASNAGYLEIATGDDSTEPIYVRQYSGAFTSLVRTLTLLDGSGNTIIPGHLYATSGLTWYSANWQPVGNITCTPTANNQEWSIDVGSTSYTGSYFHIWSGRNQASILQCFVDDNRVVIPSGTLTTSKMLYANGGVTGNLTGNASTATAFSSNRTIALTGDVTGSASTNGSSGWSINASVVNDSHTHSYITYNGNHAETASGTTANAPTTGMLKSSGLYATGTYNDSATPVNFGNIINVAGNGTGQLLLEWSGTDNTTGHLYYRSHRDTSTGGWAPWVTILDSGNYTSYTVTKTGGGASGNWGINITGNAASATKLNIYEARASSANLNKTANYGGAGALFHLVATSSTTTGKCPSDANILQMNWDNDGGYDAQFGISTAENRAYFRDRVSKGNAWREIAHIAAATKTGSATLPVYVAADGKVTACTASSIFSAMSWTGGTSAGPTLSITVTGQTRTAVIPTATASASGIITTGSQTFAGTKNFNGLVNLANASYYSSIRFTPPNGSSRAGEIYCFNASSSTPSVLTGSNFNFRVWSHTTGTATHLTYYENYYLPSCNADRTANASYAILTSKSKVTVAQGGTGTGTKGACSGGALYNLGCVYSASEPTSPYTGMVWLQPV